MRYNIRLERWACRHVGWVVMGMLIGWAFTSLAYEWGQPDSALERWKRSSVRVMKQGAMEGAGDDAR